MNDAKPDVPCRPPPSRSKPLKFIVKMPAIEKTL